MSAPRFFLSIALILFFLGMSATLTSHAQSQPTTHRALQPDNPRSLEALLDEVVSHQLLTEQLVGAQVAVVKDGQIFVVKGYGESNVDTHAPVDPATTLFRAGSVSKLFTWTAVMQLVEQGKLNLHADVNQYLTQFQIPAAYPQPITLYHLMTHTAGFDERELNGVSVVQDEASYKPLSDAVADALPVRIEAPGAIVAYCNYCAGLAGLIVANVSGEPFEQYVATHIFAPLGMSHSTFAQPVPLPFASDLATGYQLIEEEGILGIAPAPFIQLSPAGSLSTTATDIAAFMLAHLDGGRYGDAQLLQSDTLDEMHRQQYTFDSHVPGVTLGFFEGDRNGARTLWHAGNVDGFGSWLTLLPDDHIGIYIAFNGRSDEHARLAVTNAIIDYFNPATTAVEATSPADFAQRAELFTGSFRSTRRAEMTVQKIAAYFAPETTVIANGDGTLSIEGAGPGLTEQDGTLKRWVETEPLVFQEVGGQARLVFSTTANGEPSRFAVSSFPFVAYERLSPVEQPSLQLLGLGVILLVQAVTGIVWLGRAVAKRGKPRSATHTLGERVTRRVAGLLIVVNLALVLSVLGWLIFGGITYHIPPTFYATVLLAGLSVVGAVVLTIGTLQLWWQRTVAIGSRLHYALLTLTAWGFVALLYTVRLLGIHV